MFTIDHDLHFHSTISSCCHAEDMTPEAIVDREAAKGYKTICLTNHLWDSAVPGFSNWYEPQNIPHIEKALPLPVREGMRFAFGCEVEFCGGEKLSLAKENYDRFDFIAVSVNHMHMKGLTRPDGIETAEQMAELVTRRVEEVMKLPLPWRRVGMAHLNIHHMFKEGTPAQVLRLFDKGRWTKIFAELAKRGTGIELNAAAFVNVGDDLPVHLDFFRLAKEQGCRFYCASDAHKLEALDISFMQHVVDSLGLTEQDRYEIPE